MRYRLELVGQKTDVTGQAVVDTESGSFQVFRVQRLTSGEDYAPSVELTNAFANASIELQTAFSKVVAQRD